MNASPDTAALLSHVGWVSSLAHDLVSDAAEAEDVAQEALVSALEHPPREPGAWPAYLRALLRNAFLQRRRSGERRAARERAGARAEALPSAADSAERLAVHREVVAAVEALAEPYRQTVLLRYFDGLPPREIAARLSVPVKTVNTRLHRAHGLLRSRLDEARGGDRRAWASALASAFRSEHEAIPGPAFARLALGTAGLLLIVAIGAWILRAPPRPASLATEAGSSGESDTASQVDDLETSAPPSSREVLAAPERRSELRGRVRTPAGEGIPGAEVEVRFRPADGMKLRLGAFGQAAEDIGRARCGPEGRFAISVPENRTFDVRARASGFGVLRRPLVTGDGELDLVLEKAGTLAFVVLDARENPIAGVPIELCPFGVPDVALEPWILGRTDAMGRWTCAEVPPGVYSPKLRPPNGPPLLLVNVAVRGADVVKREVRVPDGLVFEGSVRAADTGEPVAGCTVGVGVFDNHCTTTDDQGRFRIERLEPGGGLDLWVTAQGLGDVVFQVRNRFDAPQRADFEIPRGYDLAGTLEGTDGAPLPGAWIGAYGERTGGDSQRDWAEARSGEDGAFTLPALRPDLPHALFVRSPGSATTIALLPESGAGTRIDLGPIRLDAGASLRGIVRRDDGTAAAGAIVVAERIDGLPSLAMPGSTSAPRTEETVEDTTLGVVDSGVSVGVGAGAIEPTGNVRFDALRESLAITGDDGVFHILDLARGLYRVRARIGWLRSSWREIDLAAAAIERDLSFEIARGLSLEGSVVDEEGNPLAGAWVLLFRGQKEFLERRSEATDEHGRFRIEGLEAIEYRIEAGYQSSTASGARESPFARMKLLEVFPPRTDIVIRLPRTIRMEGRVVDAGGKGLARAIVVVRDPDGRNPQAIADAEGRFHVEVVPGTVLEFEGGWPGPGGAGQESRRLAGKLSGVVAGSGEIVLHLD